MKERFGSLNPVAVEVEAVSSSIKTAEHIVLSRALAQKAITLLRDPQKLRPLKAATLVIETGAVRDLTKSLDLSGDILTIDTQPTTSQIADVIHAAQNGRIVIVPINDLDTNKEQL